MPHSISSWKQQLSQRPRVFFSFCITIGLSLEYFYTWPLEQLVHLIGEALTVAGILAITVDWFAKEQFAYDISKYLIGYRLPPEIQEHIRASQLIPIVRTNYEIRYKLTLAEPDRMRADIELAYYVKNYGVDRQTFTPKLNIEDVDKPTFISIGCHRNADGYLLRNDADNPEEKLTWKPVRPGVLGAITRDIIIEPEPEESARGRAVKQAEETLMRFKYQLLLPRDYHDLICFFTPTIGVKIITECPPDYTIRIDEAEETVSSGGIHEFKKLFIAGQFVAIRWFPITQDSPAISSKLHT